MIQKPINDNEGDIIVTKKIIEVNVLINSIEQSLILIVLRNNNDTVTIIIYITININRLINQIFI